MIMSDGEKFISEFSELCRKYVSGVRGSLISPMNVFYFKDGTSCGIGYIRKKAGFN